MGFALVLRELSRRRLLLALVVLVAAAAAILSVYRIDGGKPKARSIQHSSATTQALVDSSASALGNLADPFEPLSARAAVYANFMASPAVLKLIGEQVGLSGDQIYAAGPVNANQPRVVQEPTALKRNIQITGESNPYRLTFESQLNLPTINIYSQAPTTSQAVALANAAVVGLQRYVKGLEIEDKIPPKARVAIRQLGSANGAVVNGSISKQLAALVFVGVFLLWSLLILAVSRFLEVWRASGALEDLGASERRESDQSEAVEDQGEGVEDISELQEAPTSEHERARFDNGSPIDGEHGSRRVEDERAVLPARNVR